MVLSTRNLLRPQRTTGEKVVKYGWRKAISVTSKKATYQLTKEQA